MQGLNKKATDPPFFQPRIGEVQKEAQGLNKRATALPYFKPRPGEIQKEAPHSQSSFALLKGFFVLWYLARCPFVKYNNVEVSVDPLPRVHFFNCAFTPHSREL